VKEEGETALGLDGEKVVSPEMMRGSHSESEWENPKATNATIEIVAPRAEVGNILATRKLQNYNCSFLSTYEC
jgi:hypothetical protein